jgi:hypothetical protein
MLFLPIQTMALNTLTGNRRIFRITGWGCDYENTEDRGFQACMKIGTA